MITINAAALLAAVVLASPVGPPPADLMNPEPVSPNWFIGMTLWSWHKAAHEGDIEVYARCMTGDAVFLGTDRTERWVGAEFIDFARPHFADGHGWTYKMTDRHMQVRDDVAWVDEILFNDSYGHCRGTAILVNTGDNEAGPWRIAHYTLSFLVPNDVAKQTRGIVAEFEEKENEE